MPDLKAGAQPVNAIYHGAVPVLGVYRGAVKLWPPPVWSCTVTVANAFGQPAYWAGLFGSIDQQPVPGQVLDTFQRAGTQLYVWFLGNVSTLMAGKRVFVNGVNYGTGNIQSWVYDPGVNFTRWTGSPGPALVVGGSYLLEIK